MLSYFHPSEGNDAQYSKAEGKASLWQNLKSLEEDSDDDTERCVHSVCTFMYMDRSTSTCTYAREGGI